MVHTPLHEDRNIKPLCDYTTKMNQDDADPEQIKLDCLNQFYHLELNEIPVTAHAFYIKNYKTNQDGLKYFLDRGRHVLKLFYNYYNSSKDTVYKNLKSKVEFYKASTRAVQTEGQ